MAAGTVDNDNALHLGSREILGRDATIHRQARNERSRRTFRLKPPDLLLYVNWRYFGLRGIRILQGLPSRQSL